MNCNFSLHKQQVEARDEVFKHKLKNITCLYVRNMASAMRDFPYGRISGKARAKKQGVNKTSVPERFQSEAVFDAETC